MVDAVATDNMKVLNTQQICSFALTYFAYSVLYIGRKCLSVTKSEIGVSNAELGTWDTAFLVAYAAGQLGLGGYVERTTAARGLTMCFCTVAISLQLFVSFESIAARTCSWALNGVAQAQVFVLCVRALNPYLDPATRGKVMGFWTTSQAVGGVLANSTLVGPIGAIDCCRRSNI